MRFGPGVADGEHVRFVQDWDTAVAVATGTLNAQEAFIRGRIKLIGAYTQSAGTPQQGAALQAVVAELDSMVRNRNAAKALGSAAAAKQIAQIEAEQASLKAK